MESAATNGMSHDDDASARGFRFVVNWQSTDTSDTQAILDFWKGENAIGDPAQAAQRLREVVLHVRNATGEVVAVCTAVPFTPPRLGQPYYYFRGFIGSAWRTTWVGLAMLRRACGVLERDARERAFPCIGILLELENPWFVKHARLPRWGTTGFVYVGLSARGFKLFARYFVGARLKQAPKT